MESQSSLETPNVRKQFSVREAKNRLPELLDLAAAGVSVEILRQGAKKGRFRIIPSEPEFVERQPGALKGKIIIADAFDDEDAAIVADFEGNV